MADQPTNIALNDFVTVVNIIDACSQRGAFKGEELTSVGKLRDKFDAFIKANAPEETVEEKTEEVTE